MPLDEVCRSGIRLLLKEPAESRGFLVAFSDRHGGVSEPPYDTLNLALRVGDDRVAVEENRTRLGRAAGFDGDRLVLARQVHGTGVREVAAGESGVIGVADVLVTETPGVVLGVLAADCAPVVLIGPRRVGVVHAGWRGLAAGVIDKGVEAVSPVESAWVGPCIRACCFEVGPEVVRALRARDLPVEGDGAVDISRAAVTALSTRGVRRVVTADECTSCTPRYFSYRRDGITGRQAAVVARL